MVATVSYSITVAQFPDLNDRDNKAGEHGKNEQNFNHPIDKQTLSNQSTQMKGQLISNQRVLGGKQC
jgi:hypothetical protein